MGALLEKTENQLKPAKTSSFFLTMRSNTNALLIKVVIHWQKY